MGDIFNAEARCDRCGAQAYVLAHFKAEDLLFCAHHFAKHEEALRDQAIDLIDDRQALYAST